MSSGYEDGRALENPKFERGIHHRGAEFTEFGIFSNGTISAPSRGVLNLSTRSRLLFSSLHFTVTPVKIGVHPPFSLT
jgi:hypothetical protein